MKLQKANFAYWSRVTHTAARGNLIKQCLVFRRSSEWVFSAVIALKRVVKVLDVSGEIHREVGTVDLKLKQLFKLFVEVLIGPVLIAGVKLRSLVESFYCFLDAALTHVLHEKSEEAPVNLAHAVIVF